MRLAIHLHHATHSYNSPKLFHITVWNFHH